MSVEKATLKTIRERQFCLQDSTTRWNVRLKTACALLHGLLTLFLTVTWMCPNAGIFDGIPLGVVPEITADIVQPRGGTALYDAIGCTLQRTVTTLEALDHVPRVVVFILTDGYENASQTWRREKISKEIAKLQSDPYNWEFFFAAANQDALKEGSSISMDTRNCMTFSSNPQAMRNNWERHAANYMRHKRGDRSGFRDDERSSCM
eukprot:m.38081 g.38081  ORF g.38081 m.38081 type:complete len:206 (-) comp14601_c0_seq16:1899-2516(-)